MSNRANRGELWRECCNWLISNDLLDPNTASKPVDLAVILRDGVLLCKLATKLKNGCIDDQEIFLQYNQSPHEDDLYALQNFPAVLHTLSRLSHTDRCKQLGIRPFPDLAALPNHVDNENSIYCNLQDEVEQHSASTNQLVFNEHYHYHQQDFRKCEELYDQILQQKVQKPKILPLKYDGFKPSTKYEFCMKELLDTELKYCEALTMVIENFHDRLLNLLNTEDIETIFINIKDILKVHKNFLISLTPAVLNALNLNGDCNGGDANPNSARAIPSVSEVFIQYKLRFTCYARYCSELKLSCSRIDELMRSSAEMKRNFFDTASQFNLRDLLTVPFQRILKYSPLLMNLIDHTKDPLEKSALISANECIKDVAEYINEVKRDHEAIEVIKTIQRSITPNQKSFPTSFLDCGRLMCDGLLKLIDHREESGKPKNRYVFLFERRMIVCKQKAGLYEFKHSHDLMDYDVIDNEFDLNGRNQQNTLTRRLTATFFDMNQPSMSMMRRGFRMSNNEQTPNNNSSIVQMIFKNAKQRDEWKNALCEAIDHNMPKGAIAKGHSLLYKTYNYKCAILCSVCQKLLAGKFFQGYHCSGCNKDMHRVCSSALFCNNIAAVTRTPNNSRNSHSQQFSQLPLLTISATGTPSSSLTRRPIPKPRRSSVTSLNTFHPGEILICRCSSSPSQSFENGDSLRSPRLSVKSGDLVELIEMNIAENLALVRSSIEKDRVGTVPLDFLVRMSATLERLAMRHRKSSRSSISSNSSVFEQQIATTSSDGAQSPSSIATLSPLVSKRIIETSDKATNLEIDKHPWYFGSIGRIEANRLLENTEDGTFLVRWSAKENKHVLSQKGVCTKHVLIEYSQIEHNYYLAAQRRFNSILELVNYFRENELSEAFESIFLKLGGTVLKGRKFQVKRHWEGRETNIYLSLSYGDIVTVLDTNHEDDNWWRGRIGDAVGFFPLSYVVSIEEIPKQCASRGAIMDSTNLSETSALNQNLSARNRSQSEDGYQVDTLTKPPEINASPILRVNPPTDEGDVQVQICANNSSNDDSSLSISICSNGGSEDCNRPSSSSTIQYEYSNLFINDAVSRESSPLASIYSYNSVRPSRSTSRSTIETTI